MFVYVACFCVVAQASSKTKETPEAKAKAMVEKINTVVTLKGEQFTKLNNLFTDYYKKKAAIEADSSLKPKTKEAKLAALKDSKNTAIKGVLTPDQLKKWKDYRKKEKDKKKKGK